MTRCPYTATVNFFRNMVDLFNPVVDVSRLPGAMTETKSDSFEKTHTVRMVEALKKIEDFNMAMVWPTGNAASTVRGNLPITVFIGAEDVDTDVLVVAETHGILRGLVGEIGKKLNKEEMLPASLQKNIEQMRDLQRTYKKKGDLLAEMYKKSAVEDGKPKYYYALNRLRDNVESAACSLGADPIYIDTNKEMDELDRKSGELMDHIHTGFNETSCIAIKGFSYNIRNKEFYKDTTIGEWMYYAEWGAMALANTMKITHELTEKLPDKIKAMGGIVGQICVHFAENEDLHHPVFADLFERTVEKMQNTLVQCGSYKELSAGDKACAMMAAVGITSEDEYNVIKAKAPAKARKGIKKSGGICPLGYGKMQPS